MNDPDEPTRASPWLLPAAAAWPPGADAVRDPVAVRSLWAPERDDEPGAAGVGAASPRGPSAFDQMVDLCLWVDPVAGCIVDCNAAVTQALGWRSAELIGRPLRSLAASAAAGAPAGDGAGDTAADGFAWQAMAHAGTLADADIDVLTRHGRIVPMSASSSPLRSAGGAALCGLTVWRDVSRRRRVEQALVDGERRLKALACELTLAEARERARIAQGLHDEIGQLLTMAHFKLDEWAGSLARPTPRDRPADSHGLRRRRGDAAIPEDAAATAVAELADLLKQAAQATRSATFELSCPLLRPLGLQPAIESLAQRVARSSRLQVRVDGTLPPLALPDEVLAIVFRVVRELALNAQKHAHAQRLEIRLKADGGELSICVADDGTGFDPAPRARGPGPDGGFGLPSVDAQMQAIGGRLALDARPGLGTRATVLLPLPAAA